MKTLLAAAMLFVCAISNAQYGNQDSINIPVTGYTQSSIKALLHKPADYTTSKKYPLLVAFGGNGQLGDQLKLLYNTLTPAKDLKNGAQFVVTNPQDGQQYEFVVCSPQGTHKNPKDFGDWLNPSQVKSVLTYLKQNVSVDLSRIYLTGLSSGGWTVLKAILTDTSIANQIAGVVLASAEGDGAFPSLLCNIPAANIAYWAIYEQGEAFASLNNQYVNGINNCNPKPLIPAIQTKAPGSEHAGWLYAYDTTFTPTESGNLNYLQWLLKYKKGTVVTPPANTITTDPVNGSPFCIKTTAGANVVVSFKSVGNYNAGNVYTLQMSDAFGSFANPVNIGSITGTANAGFISGVIPANTPTGGNYRFRVVSNNPAIVGASNTNNIIINLAGSSIAPTATQNIATNANGVMLTVNEKSKPIKRLWFDNGINAIDTSVNFTPFYTTAGTHVITCISYFLCDTITSNAVTINVTATTRNTRIILKKGADNGIYLKCGSFPYKHGDSLELRAQDGPFSYVTLECFDSITIINSGGQVLLTNFNGNAIPGGFTFFSCTHIKLTGTGSDNDEYGFKITTPNNRGVGVNVYGRSANIEMDHLDIYNKGAGMWVKQEQLNNNCDSNQAFPKWVIHDIKIHDNWFHNLLQEGIYAGSTAPDGTAGTQHAIVFCKNGISSTDSTTGSVRDNLLPMRLGNFDVYKNIYDSLGRGAIQLSDADSGMSYIHDNRMTNIGFEFNTDQGNAVETGTYTRAKIYNNYIDSTYSNGARFFGAYTEFYNNYIDHSGMLGDSVLSNISNININNPRGKYPTIANDTFNTFLIQDNTVLNKTGAYNITGNNQTPARWSNDSKICTSGTINLPVGIPYSTDCNAPSYILVYDTVHERHDSLKQKTFTRHFNVTRFSDSVKVKLQWIYYLNGAVTNRADTISRWFYNTPFTFDSTATFDSVFHKRYWIDTVYVDTLWTNYQLGMFYYNPLGLVSFQHVMDTANYVGVSWLRLGFTRGGGATYNVGTANANGLHVLLTYNNSSNGAAGYGTSADSLITVAAPDWITAGNEPAMNDSENIAAYLNDASALITAAHNHNVKVADGGFEKTIMLNYVKDLQDRGKTDSANTIISLYGLNMASTASVHYRLKNDSLITGCAALNFDAVALHWAEPYFDTTITTLSNYLPEVAKFLTRKTGHKVIITELATTNHKCELLTAEIKQAIAVVPDGPVMYFAGTGTAGDDVKNLDCLKITVSGLK